MIDRLVNSKRLQTNPRARAEAAGRVAVRKAAAAPVRRRLGVAERERQIVDGAIAFFAEHGFDAQMRELASAIGVTHALVYHYFPTKQALVDRVYQDVFEGRWKTEWEALLDDKSLSPADKLTQFYGDYARTVLTRDFVRIIVFSGLTDRTITDRYFQKLSERLFPRLVRETRKHRACTSRARTTAREHELLMGLHGGIFYGGMRSFIYGQALHGSAPALDDAACIADRVRGYLAASEALEPLGKSL